MFEAILTETPLCLWPMTADQPMNAAHRQFLHVARGFDYSHYLNTVTQYLKVGFELIQVRNGPHIGKPS